MSGQVGRQSGRGCWAGQEGRHRQPGDEGQLTRQAAQAGQVPRQTGRQAGRAGAHAGQADKWTGQADNWPHTRTHARTHAPGGRLRLRHSWQCWSQTHNSQTQPAFQWVGGWVAKGSRRARVNTCKLGQQQATRWQACSQGLCLVAVAWKAGGTHCQLSARTAQRTATASSAAPHLQLALVEEGAAQPLGLPVCEPDVFKFD